MIMAGGTGGHVYPALAVARALQARSNSVVWLGTHRGLESRVVPGKSDPELETTFDFAYVESLFGDGCCFHIYNSVCIDGDLYG